MSTQAPDAGAWGKVVCPNWLRSKSRIRSGAVAQRKHDGRARSSGLRPAPACNRSPASCRETKTAPQTRNVPLLQDRTVAAQANYFRIPGKHQRARNGRINLHNRHRSCPRPSSRSGISGREHRRRPLTPPRYVLLYKRHLQRVVRANLQPPLQHPVFTPSRRWRALCPESGQRFGRLRVLVAIRSLRAYFHEMPCNQDSVVER